MKKRFNVTGVCHPDRHYMADISAKFARVLEMVEQGDYFAINRPRQYGKTTLLYRLGDALSQSGNYLVFNLSFEGIGDDIFREEHLFAQGFVRQLAYRTDPPASELADWLSSQAPEITDFERLSLLVSDLVRRAGKPVVLLIDEVDKSSNNQLFVSFLGILRNKFLERDRFPTFHSVVLAGIHDVKTLKLKIRPDAERKYNSPWNIAANFKVDMGLQPHEIQPMLEEYARDREVATDAPAVAERLFYYTSGYPFLVSSLCKIFDEDLLPQKIERTWTVADVDTAARQLVGECNTNFDEAIKNLRNTPDLYDLIHKMLIEGQEFSFNPHADLIQIGMVYGLLANRNDRLALHNRIYREVILNYMSSNAEHTSPIAGREIAETYRLPGNRLDVKKALLKFQELLRAEYSGKDRKFLEREGRLVFLAFLKPILNGHGYAFKEPQISEEKRLDILITYHEHRYVIELKRWYGPPAHERGLDQLADYLDTLGLDAGYLLIFDHRADKPWTDAEMEHRGKRVFAVWA